MLAIAIRLKRDRDGINVFECPWIVGFQNPPFLGYVLFFPG